MKRALTLLLALVLVLGLTLPAAAAEEDQTEQVYALAKEAVLNWETELDLSGMKVYRDTASAISARLQKDPELFFLDYCTTWYYDDGLVTKLEFHYLEDFSPESVTLFEAAVDEALEVILPGMDVLQAALVLHDYLAVHVAYDSENYNRGTIPEVSYTAYGALVLGTAVCQGYTQAYRVLLDRCGIPSAYISSDGMNHGWAQVKLGDSWYHVDVTWDDPTPDTPGKARHSYFLLSDDAISDEEHRHYGWEADYTCTDTRFDTDKFWIDSSAPIPFTDADTYWLLHEQGDSSDQSLSLLRRSWSTGEYEVVQTVWDYWPVWGKENYYWTDAYSGLVLWDSRVFFNDSLRVYAYDPADGSFETVFTYTGGEGYLYGLASAGTALEVLLKKDPNEDGELYILPLERKYAAVREPFTDVPRNAYYHDAVLWAYDHTVTTGTSDTEFSPWNACTRGQVVTFLWRAMGKPAPQTIANPFADVPENAYYRDAVLWAVEQGITNGTGTDAEGMPIFSPDTDCSYAHILTFLWRTLTGNSASSYGTWYSEPLDWAGSLLTDTAPGADTARVTENCPRCDVVTYLWRALEKAA